MVESEDSFSQEQQWPEARTYQDQSPQQNLRILIPEIYSHIHPAIKCLFPPKEFQKFPQTGHLKYCLEKWEKPTKTYNRPLHFEYRERVPDSFSVCPCSEIFSVTYFNDPSGKGFSGPRGRKNVKESCNKGCPTRSQSFLQLNICRT